MFENIIQSIICAQYEHTLGRSRPINRDTGAIATDPNNAMEITFSLSNHWDREDGYRHLKILIYGGGSNYIGVYGSLDWSVIENEAILDDDTTAHAYTEGKTPWVLYGYHDSGWREAVGYILREFSERISCINALFNGATGWYKVVPISKSAADALSDINRSRYDSRSKESWKRLSELEFQFPDVEKAIEEV
jgi:hypothetical protein